MGESNSLRSFLSRPFYTTHFMDTSFWEPFVHRVSRQHGFDSSEVKPGLAGTFPTFIVELGANGVQQSSGFIVVKFFGSAFNGIEAYKIERGLGEWLKSHYLPIPSPAILAEGQLEPDWWYLIYEFIPGISIGQVRDQLSRDEWLNLAHQMGLYIQILHSISIPDLPDQQTAVSTTWDGFIQFLQRQRRSCLANHRTWNDLPMHLLSQLESYVLPDEKLADFSLPPHLIHADLTADHLLGRLAGGRWQILAIIDWGDAITGDLLYELFALQFDLFRGDKQLLKPCLETYNLPDFYQQDFTRKAMSMVLLHQFPLPAWIIEPHRDAHTLVELGERLFGL